MNSRMRDGVRFPSDVAGVPTGQSGPVISYKVSPEEIEARFGPIRRRRPTKAVAGAPAMQPKEEPSMQQAAVVGSGGTGDLSVGEMIRQTIQPPPHFVMGSGRIRVTDLAAKAAALLTLLGEDAVLLVENGVIVVRA